jgi:hypothetical protein
VGVYSQIRREALKKTFRRRQKSNGECVEFWSSIDQSECLMDGRREVATLAKFCTSLARYFFGFGLPQSPQSLAWLWEF